MIKFTDIRPFQGSSTHVCPNECLLTLRALVENLPDDLPKGGSIASGGEVPLTVVLPKVKSLQIVDHNYGSLWWTCTKILMVQHLTNAEIRAMLDTPTAFMDFITRHGNENPMTTRMFSRYEPKNAFGFSAYWKKEITDTHLDIIRRKLDSIEVIHGDIRDLDPNLDLLYISNALEHSAHDGKAELLIQQIHSRVNLRGSIISTGRSTPQKCVARIVVPEKCDTAMGHLTWHYVLSKPTIASGLAPIEITPHRPITILGQDSWGYPIKRDLDLRMLTCKAFHNALMEKRQQAQWRQECHNRRSQNAA